jgi:hypothetical protein
MKNLTFLPRLFVAVLTLGWLCSATAFADYTVTGRFQYLDHEFNINGYTLVVTPRPIRFADVRIMAGANPTLGGTPLAFGATDVDGSYSISVPGNLAQPITALCVTSSSQTPGILLDVRVAIDTSSLAGDFYSVASAAQNADGTPSPVNMGTTYTIDNTDANKAFNIWDVANDSLQFVASPNANGSYPNKKLTLIWGSSQTNTGSFFSFNGTDRYVYVGVLGYYDDTVIAHEIGHYMDNMYSHSDSPGGTHYLGDDTQDIRLSWGEGLATFLGSSSRKFKGYPTPEIYVSTDGRNLNFGYEVEHLSVGIGTSPITSKTGSTNEVAVTAALWDVTDGPNDYSPPGDDDSMQRPFSDVWRVLTQYFPTVTRPGISIETFWIGWQATFNPSSSDLSLLQDTFNRVNGIEFIADTQEPDDTPGQAPLNTLPQRPAPISGSKVVISELDLGSVDSAELYNAGSVEADLTGWTLEASAPGYAAVTFVIPSFKLAPGAFVVLYETSGTNTNSTLYFNNNISWNNGTDGACALKDNKGIGIDFVRWGNSTVAIPSGTSFNGPNPSSPPSGYNLARNFAETDTDTGSDWTAQTSTLGTYNITGQEKHHTYYPVGDIDYVAFNATAGNYYLAETFRLFDGADTVLDVTSTDGVTVLATNDDFGTSKASRLAWTAPASGKYYLRSRRFDGSSNYAQFGSYDLRMVESASPFSIALPQILTVSQPGQGGKFQTLADAITASSNGDTVQILDNGFYAESVTIQNKSLTLKAAAGKNPVIDGRNSSAQFNLLVYNAKTVRIDGITILAGKLGVYVYGGNVTLANIVITGASDPTYADGIEVVGSGSSATIVNCTIVNNNRYGLAVGNQATVKVVNSIIQGNSLVGNSLVDIYNQGSPASLVVKNSLIGTGGYNGTNGNISGDPQFVNAAGFDFHLKSTSPAIDAGDAADPDLPLTDADGLPRSIDGKGTGHAVPDMGAYEYLPSGLLTSSAIFPQIATGGTPVYRTSIVGINTGSVAAVANLSLTKSDGTPFPITILNAPEALPDSAAVQPEAVAAASKSGSSFDLSIAAGGTARFEATSSGDTTAGYARFASSVPVNGTALFKTVSNNAVQSEAGVGLAKPTKSFFVYIDNLNSAISGYAVANYGTTPANLTMTLRDASGAQKDQTNLTLDPGKHLPEFAYQRFSNTAPAGFEGSIEFSSDQFVAAVALRYDNPAHDVFSTIPVLVDEASTTLYFPQVADGGGYRTNFILVNPSNTPTFATLEFFNHDGTPLGLPIGGQVRTKSDPVPLLGKGVAHLLTDGTTAGTISGWVRVTTTSGVAIGGSAIFQTLSGTRITSEAGVSASPFRPHFTGYVSSIGDTWSGLAICNPNSTAVTVTLKLRDTSGQIAATTSFNLNPLGHVAQFSWQWFGSAYNGLEGTLEVVATGPVSAVALRYDNSQHNVFATLPVIVIP